jgi:hypothetical protein
MTTQQKSEIAHLKVTFRAIELGIVLSKPVIETRYDFIADTNGKLERCQVKYAGKPNRNSEGAVVVNLRSWAPGRKRERVYTADEVDALLVYVPQVDMVCKFPPAMFVGKASFILRYAPPKNGQTKGLVLVEQYRW